MIFNIIFNIIITIAIIIIISVIVIVIIIIFSIVIVKHSLRCHLLWIAMSSDLVCVRIGLLDGIDSNFGFQKIQF